MTQAGSGCLDNGCSLRIVDRKFLLQLLHRRQFVVVFLQSRFDVFGSNPTSPAISVSLLYNGFYWIDENTAVPALGKLSSEAYVVEDLACNIRIGRYC